MTLSWEMVIMVPSFRMVMITREITGSCSQPSVTQSNQKGANDGEQLQNDGQDKRKKVQ